MIVYDDGRCRQDVGVRPQEDVFAYVIRDDHVCETYWYMTIANDDADDDDADGVSRGVFVMIVYIVHMNEDLS